MLGRAVGRARWLHVSPGESMKNQLCRDAVRRWCVARHGWHVPGAGCRRCPPRGSCRCPGVGCLFPESWGARPREPRSPRLRQQAVSPLRWGLQQLFAFYNQFPSEMF